MASKNLVIKGFDIEPDYLSHNSPKNGRISFLSLETKPICNARCLYCSTGPELGKNIENPLTISEYKNIIKQAKDLGAKTVVFPGIGEPTLDENLLNIINFEYNNNLVSVVYTNALFSPELINFFYTHDVSLLIKFDTLNRNHYSRLIKNSFKKFKQNLDMILKLYCTKESKNNVTRIGACTEVTNLNKKDIQEVADFCTEYIIKHFVTGLTKVGWAKDNWNLLVGGNAKELNEIVAKYSTGVSSQTIDNRCGLFSYGITIDVNGDLIGCSTARWIRLGNIRKNSLQELITIYREKVWNTKESYCLAREISLGGG